MGVRFVGMDWMRPICCIFWFIHIIIYYSCTYIASRSWLDICVCGAVFAKVELLVEGVYGNIWVGENGNNVIGKL